MKVSLSLYQIHCVWSWKVWLAGILFIMPFAGIIILYHVIYSIQDGVFARKVIEIVMCAVFFLVPYILHPSFHLHHWYMGFIFGMQCNLDVWWSRMSMAWFWGLYINGIAVYGRDLILTCAYPFYQSTDLKCSYMDCYRPDMDQDKISNSSYYKPMPEPN